MNNNQSRKWHLSLNNPEKYGYDKDAIVKLLEVITISYGCFCYEIGEKGNRHVHIYIYSKSPIRFNRLKSLFPEAHIEVARGSSQENRDYITKSGKWEHDKKAETNLKETFYEVGNITVERTDQVGKNERLYEMVESGMSDKEIIEEDKGYIYRLKPIEELRQLLIEEKYREINRDLKVVYVWGETGTGKTYGIQKKHGNRNICRITSYRKNGSGIYFDGYKNEEVLVFEEFNSQAPIEEMQNYLDIYPLKLPARYADKVACYTTVYLTSNISLYDQYRNVQIERPKTWNAFLRRINTVIEYKSDGEIVVTELKKGKAYEHAKRNSCKSRTKNKSNN